MATITRGDKDQYVDALRDALEAYERQFVGSKADLYRQNPASIRIRIVDSRFDRLSRPQRHDEVWDFLLKHVDEDTMAEVSTLILLPPKDVGSSFANHEFDHPSTSQP